MVLERKEIPRLERREDRMERLYRRLGTRFIWCVKREQMIAVDVCLSRLSECKPKKRCENFHNYWNGIRKEKKK